jgi:hypothetical protein
MCWQRRGVLRKGDAAMRKFRKIAMGMLIAGIASCCGSTEAGCADYQQVSGLIDLRTSFSDGAHDLQSIVELARKRGFGVLVVNDHDRMAMEYGIPPFRHIIKKRVERNSINKKGAGEYLSAIKKIGRAYPDMIIIPGSETAPFYYWSGSLLKKNLTAHNHEKRILTAGLEKEEDYRDLPILHNGFSKRFAGTFMLPVGMFCIPFLLGLVLIRIKGWYRIAGGMIAGVSLLLVINVSPFRNSPFDQYHGDQGIAPYQLLIDYVNQRGGLSFWNYPETKSGVRKMGPIFVHTPPYPEALMESRGYTGFAALYGDEVTVIEPGNIWDKVLKEYCAGQRDNPAWGIAAADFHREGESGEKLGNFPTVFLVKERTKKGILDAMKKGRMYACRGKHPHYAKLDEFSVYSPEGKLQGISGDEVIVKRFPRIRVALSSNTSTESRVRVRLIRSGQVIAQVEGRLPLEIEHEDKDIRRGVKEYYRTDLHGYGTIVSNPIFVTSE